MRRGRRGLRGSPRFEAVASHSREEFEHILQRLSRARAAGELPAYLDQPLDDLVQKLGLESDGSEGAPSS